jgi:hypothetical protein
MSEPNPSFSNAGGDMQPAGEYTYPNGQTKYIPYKYVPGQTPYSTDPITGQPVPANPGFITDTSDGGDFYDPVLGSYNQP